MLKNKSHFLKIYLVSTTIILRKKYSIENGKLKKVGELKSLINFTMNMPLSNSKRPSVTICCFRSTMQLTMKIKILYNEINGEVFLCLTSKS